MAVIIPDFIQLCSHQITNIRKYTLESLVSVAHHKLSLLREHIEALLEIIKGETTFKEDLVVEIDLGAFKHKVDEGRGIRYEGLQLLRALLDRVPASSAIEIVMTGLQDPDPDC